MNDPLLSVCLITYNHKKYIRQAIETVLMQKTNFDFELIIADDCSTDGTREIVEEYKKKNPDCIKLILQKKNVGPAKNWIELITTPKSKYIAYFEGDDYWTDSLKLQKQVDFLEANSDYGICFHNVQQLNDFDPNKNWIIPNNQHDIDYTIEDYILSNKTATCSMVYRRECLGIIPSWIERATFGDLGLILIVLFNSNGIGRVLKETMGVYRVHHNSIHGKLHKNNFGLIEAYGQHIQFAKIISKELLIEKKYRKIILKKMLETYKILSNLYKQENDVLQYVKSVLLVKYYQLLIKLA